MDDHAQIADCAGCLCLASRRAARAITAAFDRRLRPHGVRATQFTILVMLMLKGPTPLRELARLLGMERTTLTRNLDLLETRGLCESHIAEGSRIATATDAGRAMVRKAFPAWRASQDAVLASMGQGGAEAVRRLSKIAVS
jgi:DNA-binding MarR family transcriptional regulator